MGNISAAAVLSALSDQKRLRLFADFVIAGEGSAEAITTTADRDTSKALARLLTVGLLIDGAEGSYAVNVSAFGAALASLRPAGSARYPEEIARYFDERGRIQQVPSGGEPRRALLTFVVAEEFAVDLEYSEAQVNHVFRKFHDDYSMLRRYSVDLKLLHRCNDGSRYRRANLDLY